MRTHNRPNVGHTQMHHRLYYLLRPNSRIGVRRQRNALRFAVCECVCIPQLAANIESVLLFVSQHSHTGTEYGEHTVMVFKLHFKVFLAQQFSVFLVAVGD